MRKPSLGLSIRSLMEVIVIIALVVWCGMQWRLHVLSKHYQQVANALKGRTQFYQDNDDQLKVKMKDLRTRRLNLVSDLMKCMNSNSQNMADKRCLQMVEEIWKLEILEGHSSDAEEENEGRRRQSELEWRRYHDASLSLGASPPPLPSMTP